MARKPKRSTDPKHLRKVEGIKIRRRILILAMGGKCEFCPSRAGLEFHHTEQRTWTARDVSRWSRQSIYEHEWSEGKLKLACGPCNKKLGQPETTGEPDW